MLKELDKKSLCYLVIVLAVALLVFAGLLYYLSRPTKIEILEEVPEEKPAPIEEIPEPFKPGEIGEPEEGESPRIELPMAISATIGTIKDIQKDRLIILGDGSNFSDQQPRDLTLILTESAITLEPGQKIGYQGFEGLRHLKIGDQIAVSSPENIRGKTEFIVNYIINKL